MADLRYRDRMTLEDLLKMSDGYVLNFTDKTFKDFIGSSINKDIHSYTRNGTSKANKLRCFLAKESNYTVSKLLSDIADTFFEGKDKNKILEIANHLQSKKSDIIANDKINNLEHLSEFIDSAWKNFQNEEYWEVITKSRTILEITFKEICKKYSLEYNETDLGEAFDIIRKYFKMDGKNDKYPNCIKGLISASCQIVNNIANARNDMSTAHAPKYKPTKYQAKFILEQSISLMNFMLDVIEDKNFPY